VTRRAFRLRWWCSLLALREFLSKLRNLFRGRRPVGPAGVAVKHQIAGFEGIFKLVPGKQDGLVVIVRTYNFECGSVAHVVCLAERP
jgi:hypothetical protein